MPEGTTFSQMDLLDENTMLPSSSLKKKHLACNYHKVREAIAAGFIQFGYISTDLNLADICTKPLSKGPFHALLRTYLFRRPKYISETKPPIDGPVPVHMPEVVASALCYQYV